MADRSKIQILRWFTYDQLPPELQPYSKPFCDLAFEMVDAMVDGPELRDGLRSLLKAKDCFVRQGILTIEETNA